MTPAKTTDAQPPGRVPLSSSPWNFEEPACKGVLLRWQMTHWCNFNCSYCCSRITSRLDSAKVSSVQPSDAGASFDLSRLLPTRTPPDRITGHAFSNYTVEEWCAAIHQRFAHQRLALTLNGGEPFWDLHNTCRFLSEVAGWDNVDNIRVDTNASWTPPADLRGHHLAKINLNAAWHPSQATLEQFADKLALYQDRGFRLTMVNFVIGVDRIPLYERLVERVAPLGVAVNPSIYIPTLLERSHYRRTETELAFYRRFLTDFDIACRSGAANPQGSPCRYPTVAYMMDVAGELAVACHGSRKGHLFAGPIPDRFDDWVACPKNSCICVDMYSFRQDAPPSRTADMNTLASYVLDAIRPSPS